MSKRLRIITIVLLTICTLLNFITFNFVFVDKEVYIDFSENILSIPMFILILIYIFININKFKYFDLTTFSKYLNIVNISYIILYLISLFFTIYYRESLLLAYNFSHLESCIPIYVVLYCLFIIWSFLLKKKKVK